MNPRIAVRRKHPLQKSKDQQRNANQEWRKVYATERWKKLSKLMRATHPLCQRCEMQGSVRPTEHVHHIEPLSWGGEPYAMSNLLCLCENCHRVLHTIEGSSRYVYKQKCMAIKEYQEKQSK